MPTTIGNLITLDGQFVMRPANTVPGYQVYGALLNDSTLGQNYVIGVKATITTDPAIGAKSRQPPIDDLDIGCRSTRWLVDQAY